MKHYKYIALIAMLSAYTFQLPILAGNTPSLGVSAMNTSAVVQSFSTCTPTPVPLAMSMALVEWKPGFPIVHPYDFKTSTENSLTHVELPALNPFTGAFGDYREAMNNLRKDYLRFITEEYRKGNITKKRVKQAVKKDDQRAVLRCTTNGTCEFAEFIPFYKEVFKINGNVVTEFEKHANATCTPRKRSTRR